MEQPMSPDSLPPSPQPGDDATGGGAGGAIERESRYFDCVAVLDRHGVIHYCSAGLALMAGRTAGELTGRSVNSLLPGLPLSLETEDGILSPVGSLSTPPIGRPFTLLAADGARLKVEATVRPLEIDGACSSFAGEASRPPASRCWSGSPGLPSGRRMLSRSPTRPASSGS
jgi:hypothetical protein